MDYLKFGNEQFSEYLMEIHKDTRTQVLLNIKSQTRSNFRTALAQIAGCSTRVNLTRLSREELKKYTSNNSKSIKPIPHSNTTQDQSNRSLENHATSIEDLQIPLITSQSGSEHNKPLDNSSYNHLEDVQSSTSSNELNYSQKEEETRVSSPQNYPVLISDVKTCDQQTFDLMKSSKETTINITSPVEQVSVLSKKPKSKLDQKIDSEVSSSNSSSALNTISNTKEMKSTNQNKPDTMKPDAKLQSEKYKLTIIDLFGEDDSSREINIPAHKKILNSSPKDNITPNKTFEDKCSTSGKPEIRRKSSCEENEERRFKPSHSRDKEDGRTTSKIVNRRKTVSQEESTKDAASQRLRSKSVDKLADVKTNKMVRRKTICEEELNEDQRQRTRSKSKEKQLASKLPQRKSSHQENESKAPTASSSKNNEPNNVRRKSCSSKEDKTTKSVDKMVRRKTICEEEINEEQRQKTRSKSREKQLLQYLVASKIPQKKNSQDTPSSSNNVRRKSTSSKEERSIRTKSVDKEIVASNAGKIKPSSKGETKSARRKSTIYDTESSEDDSAKRSSVSSKNKGKSIIDTDSSDDDSSKRRNSSKSTRKEAITPAKVVRSKSFSQDTELRKSDKVSSKFEAKPTRRKSIYDFVSSEDDSSKRSSISSKNSAEKVVKRKSIIYDTDSSDDHSSKRRSRSKSCSKEAVAPKSNEAKQVRSKSTLQDTKSNETKVVRSQENNSSIDNKLKNKTNSKYRDKEETIKKTSKPEKQSQSSSKVDNNSSTVKRRQSTSSTSSKSSQNTELSSKKSSIQEKNATSIFKRSYSTATCGSNSPSYLSEASSSSKLSSVSTQDDSSISSLDSSKLSKRTKISSNKEKTPTPVASNKSSSKGSTSSTQRKPPKDDSNSSKARKDADSSNKNRNKSDDRKDKEDLSQRKKSVDTSKTAREEPKKPSSIPVRTKSTESIEFNSDSSLDDVNLVSRKTIDKEEKMPQTPTRKLCSTPENESSDMNLAAVKRRIFCCKSYLSSNKSPVLKRTVSAPVRQESIETELETIFNNSAPKRKKQEGEKDKEETTPKMTSRSLSRSSLHSSEDATEEPAGKRKRSLSTSQDSATSKRRKSQESRETTPTSQNDSYIKYADLVEQMLVTPTTKTSKERIDFVAPLSSSKKGFSKPHYSEDTTYDSVIVIQEKENSPHKLLVRKKTVKEVEEFQKRIVSRRHSFHFEEIKPKDEPSESTQAKEDSSKPKEPKKITQRRKSIHEITDFSESAKPIKSILKRRSSDCSDSSTLTIKREVVDVNDNTIPEQVRIDLENIDIDKMFPSTSKEDIITLEVSSEDGSPKREPSTSTKELSTNSDNCKADIEKEVSDKIQEDIIKKLKINEDTEILSTDQAVDATRDLFVSLLYIYEQYYKRTAEVESQTKLGLFTDMTIKKNYFTTRRDSDLTKLYNKLITIKVNHFSLILFYDRLVRLLKEAFNNYKEITEVVIIYFMQRIIWILLDVFSSPSDEKYLFNHVTACESVEYLVVKYDSITKNVTELDKKLNECFNDLSKTTSNTKSTKEPSAPIIITLKTPLKQNLSLPIIDDEVPSTSKPNPPPQKRRGRPPKKIIHPDAVAVIPKQKLPAKTQKTKVYEKILPKTQNPTENVDDIAGLFDNINKTKSYLDTGICKEAIGPPKSSEENIIAPQVRRKSLTSYEVTFDNNTTSSNTSNKNFNMEQICTVSKTIENVVKESQINIKQPQQEIVVPKKKINVPDVVNYSSDSSLDLIIDEYRQKTNETTDNDNTSILQLTNEILQLTKEKSKTPDIQKQRMITLDGTIVSQNNNKMVPPPRIEETSALPTQRREIFPSQNVPKGQVQTNMYSVPRTQFLIPQNSVVSSTVPVPVPAPVPAPFPAPQSVVLSQNVPKIVQNMPHISQNNTSVPNSLNLRPVSHLSNVSVTQVNPNLSHVNSSLNRPINSQNSNSPINLSCVVPACNKNTSFLNNTNCIASQNNTFVPMNQSSQNLAQKGPPCSQNNIFVPVNQANQNFVQKGPHFTQNNTVVPISQASQNLAQKGSPYSQNNTVFPINLASQNLAQKGPPCSQNSTFVPMNQASQNMPQNGSPYSQNNTFVPVNQASQNLAQKGSPFNQNNTAVPMNQANQNLAQKGLPYSQNNTFVPVAQASQNNTAVPMNQANHNLAQKGLPYSQNNSFVPVTQASQNLAQKGPPYSQNNTVVSGSPLNQNYTVVPMNQASQNLAQAGSPCSQNNTTVQVRQPSQNPTRNSPQNQGSGKDSYIKSLLKSTHFRNIPSQPQITTPPSTQRSVPQHPPANLPQNMNPQNYPHISYPNQQAMMSHYPSPHQQIANQSNPVYQYGHSNELVTYPIPSMYRQATMNEQIYHRNLDYAYENLRRHAIAQQNYEMMMRDRMNRNPPPYEDHNFTSQESINPDFRKGPPQPKPPNQLNHPKTTHQQAPSNKQVLPAPQSAAKSLVELKEMAEQQNEPSSQQTSSRSLEELEAMTAHTIDYLLEPNKNRKVLKKNLVRPDLNEIERLRRELEQINRNFPVPTTNTTGEESSQKSSSSKDSLKHTIKWRMKKSLLRNDQQKDSTLDQNRQDGSVIRYQPEGHNALRNMSRDSGYLSPPDIAHQNFEQQEVLCDRCLEPSNLMCSGCHTYYCSDVCQQLSWPTHEQKCFTLIQPTE